MSALAGARRLLPGADRPASANAFLGLVGVGGVLGWILTYGVVVVSLPPGSGPISPKTGAWLVTALWLVLVAVGILVGYARVESGVLVSAPVLAWTALVVVGFVASSYGTASGNAALMWGAWYVVLVVGYLLTGVLVTRGGIYLAAGLASAAATGVVFFVLAPEARPHSLVLGVLSVVPVVVDAARGGRQPNDDGVPVVKAERLETSGAGGVVEAD